MVKTESAAQVMSGLINKGRPNAAFRYATSDVPTADDKADANFWFMSSLAARQFAGDTAVVRMRHDMARRCANYSPQMEGDFHRDAAISLIRARRLKSAASELDRAAVIHEGDTNREAAIWMVRGRLEFARGSLTAALADHDVADGLWTALAEENRPYDAQWVLNNRYHRLRAAACFGMSDQETSQIADIDYRYVLAHGNRRQRIGARFARHGGKPGIRLFDRFVEPLLVR